jgi:molybdopterin synthase catalytic subunit
MIRIQTEDFNQQEEYERLQSTKVTGAIVCFVGLVREFQPNQPAESKANFLLQHYPGMTEKVLEKITQQAEQRWDIFNTTIIHRVGELAVDEQIVFVGASSAHRKEAFAACEYMIDILKTEAPFWKKEGEQWVEAKDSDQSHADKWLK